MQSQMIKSEGDQHSICNVIPEYQKEIELLKQKLAYKTALYDKIEGQVVKKTHELYKLTVELEALTHENKSLSARLQTLAEEKVALIEQVDLCKASAMLKQMMEETRYTTEVLSSVLTQERASKRQRGAQ